MSEPPFANLTDVTLADEGTNSILTDNANRAIQGIVAMQVTLLALVLKLANRLYNLHCHIALDCPIGIIS